MRPAMYIVLNRGLGMSTGKAAAQAGHAAVEGYRISMSANPPDRDFRIVRPHVPALALHEPNIVRRWYQGGHYMKLVMEARDSDHIRDIERYLNDRGFNTALIVDEGHTETEPLVPTALAVEIVDKDDPHVAATFSSLELYKPDAPTYVIFETDKLPQAHYERLKSYVDAGEVDNARRYMDALRESQRPHEPQRRKWFSRARP